MKTYAIPVIPGDGIGPEVIAEGMKVLDAAAQVHGFRIEWVTYPHGADHYLRTGELLSDRTLQELRNSKPSILVPVVMSESRRAYWRGALFSRFVIISTSTSTCDQFACWKVSGAHFVTRSLLTSILSWSVKTRKTFMLRPEERLPSERLAASSTSPGKPIRQDSIWRSLATSPLLIRWGSLAEQEPGESCGMPLNSRGGERNTSL